jgi:hypothetical protein
LRRGQRVVEKLVSRESLARLSGDKVRCSHSNDKLRLDDVYFEEEQRGWRWVVIYLDSGLLAWELAIFGFGGLGLGVLNDSPTLQFCFPKLAHSSVLF